MMLLTTRRTSLWHTVVGAALAAIVMAPFRVEAEEAPEPSAPAETQEAQADQALPADRPEASPSAQQPAADIDPVAARMARLEHAKRLMAAEPTVQQTQQAALEHFRVNPEALNDLRYRLRTKGAVPLVLMSQSYEGFSAGRETTVTPNDGGDSINTTDDDYRAHRTRSALVLSSDLPQTIFNTSELQSYAWTMIQQHVLRISLLTYYIRQQLRLRLLVDPPADPRAYTSLSLRVRTSTGVLDSYTGGWFSRQLPPGTE